MLTASMRAAASALQALCRSSSAGTPETAQLPCTPTPRRATGRAAISSDRRAAARLEAQRKIRQGSFAPSSPVEPRLLASPQEVAPGKERVRRGCWPTDWQLPAPLRQSGTSIWASCHRLGTGTLPADGCSQVTRSLGFADIGYVFLAVC